MADKLLPNENRAWKGKTINKKTEGKELCKYCCCYWSINSPQNISKLSVKG
ncbi:hypothetical protein [Metabacillus sp. RGM 3146]|uniref:hypothetical protein n=1 Tax=Metabacillus sp. RGM 3146 TaxID=3401092 RepID=UPI003BA3486D